MDRIKESIITKQITRQKKMVRLGQVLNFSIYCLVLSYNVKKTLQGGNS